MMGRGPLAASSRLERMLPLGAQTYRLLLTSGRSVIAKWGSAWEGAVLRVIEALAIAPRLLMPPQRRYGRRGTGRPWLLLMTDLDGAPPSWRDQKALSGVMQALGELHRQTLRPDGSVLCHGDIHRANLLWDGQRATLLDWGEAYRDHPLSDLARIRFSHAPDAPGCDLPVGEAATFALARYHQHGPLAHLSWSEFQERHRQAAQQLLQREIERHRRASSGAPPAMRSWIETEMAHVQHQLELLRL